MNPLLELDRRLLLTLRRRGHTPRRDRWVVRFSRTGEHGALWLAIGLVGAAADSDRRGRWLRAVWIVLRSYALNQAVKFTVRRRRPQVGGYPPLIDTASQLSFPSAHATTAFAGARALGALAVRPLLYVLATLMALSRPYTGVHYPSDVLAGAALGTVLSR